MLKKYLGFSVLYMVIAVMILCISLAGCGYTFEEMADMSQYKKQGEMNALSYIKGKYGFDIGAVIYTKDYNDIGFSVFVNQD